MWIGRSRPFCILRISTACNIAMSIPIQSVSFPSRSMRTNPAHLLLDPGDKSTALQDRKNLCKTARSKHKKNTASPSLYASIPQPCISGPIVSRLQVASNPSPSCWRLGIFHRSEVTASMRVVESYHSHLTSQPRSGDLDLRRGFRCNRMDTMSIDHDCTCSDRSSSRAPPSLVSYLS